jgi:hypothetical protein
MGSYDILNPILCKMILILLPVEDSFPFIQISVGIIFIDAKGLMLSLISYYDFTNTHNISIIYLHIGLQVY